MKDPILIKPIEPKPTDFADFHDEIKEGRTASENSQYIKAYRKYQRLLQEYNDNVEKTAQLKLIRLVKNASEKYCLKHLNITRNK